MGASEPSAAAPRPWLALAVGAVAVAGVAWVLREVSLAQRPPDAPVPVAWDQEACAHCRMLVSEQRFAAQAHMLGGVVHHFDDPGCALLWAQEHPSDLHELWFHDSESQSWLRRADVGFVPLEPSPMGYGLGARPRNEAGAISPEQALDLARGLETRPEER